MSELNSNLNTSSIFGENNLELPRTIEPATAVGWLGCVDWTPAQKSPLFQLACLCFMVGYLSPSAGQSSLFLHAAMILGYLIYATWAWNVICTPSIFTWACIFILLNTCQILNKLYQLRTVRFAPDMESLYVHLFEPFKVTRKEFGKLISSDYAHFIPMSTGDSYAVENITRTDRLGLVLRGRMQVSCKNRPLHCVLPHEFVDSAEFHSAASLKTQNRFTVSIMALTPCELLIWDRADIEYLITKNQYLKSIMECIVAKDILKKLMVLGNQITNWRVQQPCDLRLIQNKTFLTSLQPKSTIRPNRLLSPDTDEIETSIPTDSSERKPNFPIRKSPLSLPYSANLELTQWYQAFLRNELIHGANSSPFSGYLKLS